MSVLAGFQGVSHYRDLSWFQVWNLKSVNNQITQLDHGVDKNLEELHDWKDLAHRINESILAYKPLYRLILDLLTLQFLKKWALQRILPAIITSVDNAVLKAPMTSRPLATLLKAHQYFLDNENILLPSGRVGRELKKEIEDYFKEKRDLLLEKQIVSLPLFYHATKDDNLIDIINKGVLKPGPVGVYGIGVYFSTEDEYYVGYGKYTFALDFDAIRSAQANYTEIDRSIFQSGLNNALWISIRKNVPIKWSSVAHIVVADKKAKEDMLQKLTGISDDVVEIVSCPVLTRNASDIIRKTFQKTYEYKIPPNWKKSWVGKAPTKANLPYVTV